LWEVHRRGWARELEPARPEPELEPEPAAADLGALMGDLEEGAAIEQADLFFAQ
jgi:hypothetical protein